MISSGADVHVLEDGCAAIGSTAIAGRPRHAVRAYTRALRQSVGLTEPYSGMHVRHGDKWTESKLISFSAYVAMLRDAAPIGRDVWLATDNATVAIVDSKTVPQYAFKYNVEAISGTSNSSASAAGRPNITSGEYKHAYASPTIFFMQTYADISILSRSSIFIGMRSSGMSQLSAQLKSFYADTDLDTFLLR